MNLLLHPFRAAGRLLARLLALAAAPPEPRQLRGGGIGRVALLVGVLLALGLAPIHLSPGPVAATATPLLVLVAVACVSAVAGFNRLVRRLAALDAVTVGGMRVTLGQFDQPLRAFEAWLGLLRAVGLALPALVFWVAWALVFTLIWAHAPAVCAPDAAMACTGAWRGMAANPTFGDFLYASVNFSFANPPADLVAHSRMARWATTLEVITGVALVTLYASAFFGLGAHARHVGVQPAAAPESHAPVR